MNGVAHELGGGRCRGGPYRAVGVLCGVSALVFVYFEVCKAHRSNYWVGGDGAQWLGALAAFALYAAFLFAVATALCGILRLVRVRVAANSFTAHVCVALAVAALYGVLIAFSETLSPKLAAVILCGALAYLAFSSVADSLGILSIQTTGCVGIGGLLIGTLTMHAAGSWFFLDAARSRYVTLIPFAWTGLVTLGGLLIRALHGTKGRATLRMTVWLASCALPPVLVTAAAPFAVPERDPAGNSVVLITADALRADYCSVYGGHVPTENMERLAERGDLFERAYTLAPWTLPSVNAMYASMYPPSLTPGASEDQWRAEVTAYTFDDRQRTLAERLQAKGYTTALFTGNGLLGQRVHTLRGFDYYVRLGHHIEGLTGRWAYVPYFREVLRRIAPRYADVRPVDTSVVLTTYAEAFLRCHRGQSVFLWVHYMDPHSPYDPPHAYRTLEGPWPLFCPRNPHWGTPQHLADATLDLPGEEKRYVKSLYEGEIRYVDACIRRIMEALTRHGFDDSTYVCLSADHGEELWDHGKWGHGHTLYEEVVRVPLILAGPDVVPRRITQPVSLVDLIPTFADLTQAGIDEAWQGASIAPVLRGAAPADIDRPCFTQATSLLNPEEPLQMIVAGDYKLIRGAQSGETQLYHRDDPLERTNLADEKPGRVRELQAVVDAWAASFPSTFQQIHGEDTPLTPDEEVLEQLRNLGYIE